MRPNIQSPHRFKDDHRCQANPGLGPFLHLRSSPNLRGENRHTRHYLKISGKLYRFVPSFVALYRVVPLISGKYFFANVSPVSRLNRLKSLVFPLIPTCSRVLKGEGLGPEWLNLPTSNRPQSSQVKASRAITPLTAQIQPYSIPAFLSS